MKIWILQTGEPLQIDNSGLRPMRAINLSNMLVEHGHQVTVWSTDFDHFSKKHRFGMEKVVSLSKNLNFRIIPSIGYRNNISFARLIDHFQIAFNLKRMLSKSDKPDVAFIGYPPIEIAWVLSRWLKKNKVPFLVDVKDAWPELFIRAFPIRVQKFAKFLFIPQLMMMKYIFKNANGISAPTNEFLNWCVSRTGRKRNNIDQVNPLTSPQVTFHGSDILEADNWLDRLNIQSYQNFRLSFVGTLNSNYDFKPILFAAKHLPVEFVIAGEGTLYEQLKIDCQSLPNVKIIGWISMVQASRLLNRTDIVIIPLKDSFDFRLNITNKFYDAFLNSKPILTSIGGSAESLILENKIGFKFNINDVTDLKKVLDPIISDKNQLLTLGENARKLYDKNFSYSKVYSQIVLSLERLHENS
jgi:glycosyltransferase involved in cell wall biosynthesis